jgi:hypothetical protein
MFLFFFRKKQLSEAIAKFKNRSWQARPSTPETDVEMEGHGFAFGKRRFARQGRVRSFAIGSSM